MPTNEMLADYASGAASPGVSLLVAAHMTYAPESRAKVGAFEAVGGALLADETPVLMSASGLDAALQSIAVGDDAPEADGANGRAAPALDAGPLPRSVIEAVGLDFEDIPWSFRLPGVSEYELEGYNGEKVSIMRAKPGSGIPQHTHEGRELTLVLTGAMQDGDVVYEAGDLAIATEDHDHKPRITGDCICYCLVVMDGNLRFTGRFSRALNLLAE